MSRLLERAVAYGLERLEHLAERRYSDAPLCKAPLAGDAEYLRRWEQAKAESYPAIDEFERAAGAAIEPDWFHQLGLLTQVVIKPSPPCYQHGRLLYASLRRYIRERGGQALNIVETGTARGFSALCMAKALEDAGTTGKIATFDVLPHDTPIFWNCIRDTDGPCTRGDLLAGYADLVERSVVFHRGDTRLALRRIAFPRVHFAFLDSVHTYDHVMAEFAAIGGHQRPGDMLFFDDYTPGAYPGVVAAADEICRSHGYTRTVVEARADRRYLVAEKR